MEASVAGERTNVSSRGRVHPALEISLPATRESLAVIRSTARSLLEEELRRRGIPELGNEVELALQEACARVVRGSYPGAAQCGAIVVRVELEPWLLRLEVSDEGPAYDFDGNPAPDASQPGAGGFGLPLPHATMSRVSYARRRGRNTLLLEKVLPAGSAAGDPDPAVRGEEDARASRPVGG